MVGSVDERQEECGDTANWAMHGVRDVAAFLKGSGPVRLVEASSDSMSSAFLSALRSRDVSKASEIGQNSKNWPALAMEAIAELDLAWRDDTLSIGEIVETYWTLRRTMDELVSAPIQTTRTPLVIGKAVICTPSPEQHTFGPQLLADKVRRIGWDARLWHDCALEEVTDRLSSCRVDVLGISVGTDNRLDGLANLISEVRCLSMNPDIKILVGGSAIHGASSQYRFLGADQVTTSAEEAMRFFERGWSDLERREGRYDG